APRRDRAGAGARVRRGHAGVRRGGRAAGDRARGGGRRRSGRADAGDDRAPAARADPEGGADHEHPGPHAGGARGARRAGRERPPARGSIPPPADPVVSRSAPAATAPPLGATSAEASANGEESLAAAWKRVIEEVIGKRPFLGSVVEQAVPLRVVDGQLLIRL